MKLAWVVIVGSGVGMFVMYKLGEVVACLQDVVTAAVGG